MSTCLVGLLNGTIHAPSDVNIPAVLLPVFQTMTQTDMYMTTKLSNFVDLVVDIHIYMCFTGP